MNIARNSIFAAICFTLAAVVACRSTATAAETPAEQPAAGKSLIGMLDAPLLFVKRHAYMAGHIYDDYITWRPGGGIYLIENPADPPEQRRIRPIIDPNTKETLGPGVYRDPEISWDAKRVLFAFKGKQHGHTRICEIGIDGTGLRQLTDPDCDCTKPPQENRYGKGHHDVTPCYLPDGRIVFTSTRAMALVPCFNSGVDTLHVMEADGSNIRSISVNNVNEFDPAVLNDGRILYGRWEYVDKTALYMQSLWTVSPDGRMEEALFANNLARPTAVLDARPVPGSRLIAAAFTPHNGQSVGAIVMIDPHKGKNDLGAVTNFTPEYPTEMDQGLRQGPNDPWPLSEDVVLIANNAKGHGVIQIIDRHGHRETVHAEPDIDCYAPMLVKPRPRPAVVSPHAAGTKPGRFLVADVHQGLEGVEPGTIKRLRIVEETARISGLPPGGRWWNQAFLVSWQGAYIIKNILGTVPVHEDGSAYFEVPAGRAIYFEALDADGREVQRMRTFVQAAPGATRSCVGCHEDKKAAPIRPGSVPLAMRGQPVSPEPESWGSGYIDYPTMVQPVLDKYCVRCHGGNEGIGVGLDFSGGWTWAFNISYETMIKHRLVGYLNCNNGSVHTSKRLKPRTIGSGGAPMAKTLIEKHPEMTKADRDLLLAWMDTNSNYYGTWDYTQHATCNAIRSIREPLSAAMEKAGCTECHAKGHIGNDWVNLQTPELSRILRAPMAKPKKESPSGRRCGDELGVAFCRKRKARTGYRLVDQSVQPPDVLAASIQPAWDPSGEVHIAFESTGNEHYQAMLEIIRKARSEALASPRVDMPGAEIVAGECRMNVPPPVPEQPPTLSARLRPDAGVELSWPRTAETIGLRYELHRGTKADFTTDKSTRLAITTGGRFADLLPPTGKLYYALVVTSGAEWSRPALTSIDVPPPPDPAVPTDLTIRALPGEIVLNWKGAEGAGLNYQVRRGRKGTSQFVWLNVERPRVWGHSDAEAEPGTSLVWLNVGPPWAVGYCDVDVVPGATYTYAVRSVDHRGRRSPLSNTIEATPLPEIEEPIFTVDFTDQETPTARLLDGETVQGKLHAGATLSDGTLQLGSTGFASFVHRPEFDLARAVSVACRVRIDKQSVTPVVVGCGKLSSNGWVMHQSNGGWDWRVGGISCNGGSPVVGRWVHLVGTFDGRRATLYQDGKQVASVDCHPYRVPWSGPLVFGQYRSPDPQYQFTGRIKDLKIYRRALRQEEVSPKP